MNLSIKKMAYIVSFFVMVSMFALLYYAGYYYATSHHMGADNLITKEEVANTNPGLIDQSSDNRLSHDTTDKKEDAWSNDSHEKTVAGQEQLVSTETDYVEEVFDVDTGELTKTSQPVPVVLLGLNREQLIDYLTTVQFNENDRQVMNVQLVSFSASRLVIRKTVRNLKEIYQYYVICEDDIIKIYRSDRKTLFVDTGINISHISEEHKNELNNGFYIETIHELYNYLESITS